ncbi:aldehyde dehydrogenase family protein [Frankia sp. CN7]|uniref:Aldehyde dehydrogenase family protein n=1 Tax=Frankia nepalensis TaxID=1836974 RepID=A0A937ULV5_9ACTN|nr:aldehyde dehydrogenase family protein [Frankia nepalensis]MBL7514042.1 aldehyde dehydrogenase family protein [Frankia nepalensis]MBL7626428.1 aldehyde dehydrogenase family protein [Frankia nepalensis]
MERRMTGGEGVALRDRLAPGDGLHAQAAQAAPAALGVLLARSRAAGESTEHWDQARVDQVVRAVGRACYRDELVRTVSAQVVAGTRMGTTEDLVKLHRLRVLGTMRDLHGQRTVGVIARDDERRTLTWAKPLGVVALVTPATAPCTALATSVLSLLKTRNSVILSAHPATAEPLARMVEAVRHALREVDADEDLVQLVVGADREGSRELMRAADFVVATGGAGTVARAYVSGTPAVSSGPGNATAVVDEYADVATAADLINTGASFNNGTSCSSESNALVDARVFDAFRERLEAGGALLLSDEDARRLERLLWPDGRLARHLVGRGAVEIARACGLAVPAGRRVTTLVATAVAAEPGRPLFTEKLAPVLTIAPYHAFDAAVRDVQEILDHSGRGHSCALHTGHGPVAEARVDLLARAAKACRVLVNQSTMGNAGSFSNGMEFTSVVSTGTWGGCGVSENVSWRHLYNRTTVSYPTPTQVPSAAELFDDPDLPDTLETEGD